MFNYQNSNNQLESFIPTNLISDFTYLTDRIKRKGKTLVIGEIDHSLLLQLVQNANEVIVLDGIEMKKEIEANNIESEINLLNCITFKSICELEMSLYKEYFDTIIIQDRSDIYKEWVKWPDIMLDNAICVFLNYLKNSRNVYPSYLLSDYYELEDHSFKLVDFDYSAHNFCVFFNKTNNNMPRIVESRILKKLEGFFVTREREILNNAKSLYLNEKIEKVQALNQLKEHYMKEKSIAKLFKKLENENNKLLKQYRDIEKKYNNMKRSKLGRLMMAYWKIRRRIRGS